MARKGKELAFGGWRIQVDPLVLISRVLMRQKLLLSMVAFIGGTATIGVYLAAPKIYQSRSNILIRYENFEEGYLQRLLNVAVGYFGSDLEMMTLINELDLYAKTRERLPYEMALRDIRRELGIKNTTRSIEIVFKSKDPVQAQRVVAFVTERLLGKMAELNEAPFNRDMESVEAGLRDVEPRKVKAETKLFEFGNAHPEIADRMAAMIAGSGGPSDTMSEIKKAELELQAARAGTIAPAIIGGGARKLGPEGAKLKIVEADLSKLLGEFTDSHPLVVAKKREREEQKYKADLEAKGSDSDGVPAGMNPEEAKKIRIARAEEKLKMLIEKKIEIEKQSIKKPQLQREFAELALQSQTYSSELRDLLARQQQVRRERVVAANRFQENFQLVDPARVPEIPSEPDRNKMMIAGMAITAIFGIMLAAVREAMRQVFIDATEFEEQTGLQVFAVLPNIKKEGA